MKYILFLMICSLVYFSSCVKEPVPTENVVNPSDINDKGFDFLDKMQGHWVGMNRVIVTDYPWFGWDFRAISSSHIFGIHEGGTLGNLFTSFFVSNYKGKRTIMARNGGLLNGIYRTSYFVMDSVKIDSENDSTYRFVDAVGGENTMYFEIRFKQDSLFFNVYTSNLGNRVPSRHMTFKAKRMNSDLAQLAAQKHNFPKNEVNNKLDFSNGFNDNFIHYKNGESKPVSATFLAQGGSNDVYALAKESHDPYTIVDHPTLSTLLVNLERNDKIETSDLMVYLSREPLTDDEGIFTTDMNAYNTILHFPMLQNKEDSFLFTYLHPGNYYITAIADLNNDGVPNPGDMLSISKAFELNPLEQKEIEVVNIDVQN